MRLDYSLTPGELAIETALIAGVFRLHPPIRNGAQLLALLTPMQQAIYMRMRRELPHA